MRCKKKRQRNASRDELTMCVYILCEIATVKYIAKFWNENNKRRLKIALFAHCVWRRNVGAMLVCREFIISYITRSRTEQRKKSRQSETSSNKNYAFSHFDVLCHFSSSSSTFFIPLVRQYEINRKKCTRKLILFAAEKCQHKKNGYQVVSSGWNIRTEFQLQTNQCKHSTNLLILVSKEQKKMRWK